MTTPGPTPTPSTTALAAAVLTGAIGLLLAATGCRPSSPASWQGYLEAEYVQIASPLPGTLIERPVSRGTRVRTGQPLFRLESAAEQAAVEESSRRVAEATARLDNLRKGRRPSELEALEALVTRARTTLDLHQTELARRERLLRDQVATPAEVDQARSLRDSSLAQLEAATANLATARLGARNDEILAAEAAVAAARAALDRTSWALDQKSQAAPVDALVHDTLFQPGEFIPAGQPVVTLLPPANLRVRFFVPEPEIALLPVGTTVSFHIDGTPESFSARVTHLASLPEFTPPVIYSRDARARLVYRVEADVPPEIAPRLHPGQPVDVRIPATPPANP